MLKRDSKSTKLTKISNWKNKHSLLIALVATTIFVIFGVIFLNHHELSLAEVTAWEDSKQIILGDINSFKDTSSSPIWLTILSLLSKNGFAIASMQILSLVLVSLAVFLFVYRVRLYRPAKIVSIISVAFFYFFAIIPSTYSLLPLIIVLLMLAHPSRNRHPIRFFITLALLAQVSFALACVTVVLSFDYLIRYFMAPSAKVLARKEALKNVKLNDASVSSAEVKHRAKLAENARAGSAWAIVALAVLAVSVYTAIDYAANFALKAEGMNVFSDFNNLGIIDKYLYGTTAPILEISAVIILFTMFITDLRTFVYFAGCLAAMGISTIYRPIDRPTEFQFFVAIIPVILYLFYLHTNDPSNFFKWQKKLRQKVDNIQLIETLKRVPHLHAYLFMLPIALTIPNAVGSAIDDIDRDYGSYNSIIRTFEGKNSVIVTTDYEINEMLRGFATVAGDENVVKDIRTNTSINYENYNSNESQTAAKLEAEEFKNRINTLKEQYDHVFYLEYKDPTSCGSVKSIYDDFLSETNEGSLAKLQDITTERDGADYPLMWVYNLK